MTLPEVYLSKPAVCFPKNLVDNDEVLRRVHKQFKGTEDDWSALKSAIGKVFEICNTRRRYLEPDPKTNRVADYGVEATRACLAANGTSPEDLDLLIFSGVARQYFEPATAMEVAAKLGLKETHAFDVTSACVGQLEAIHVATSYLNLHEEYNTAAICTSELSGNFLSYEVQQTSDLYFKSAGLTIGNAAACMLLSRTPWPGGSVRILQIRNHTLPGHWELCQVPIDGTFASSSVELMKLSFHTAPFLKKSLADLGWAPNDVDHYLFHQPSETMVRRVLEGIDADPDRGVYTHHLYGNNVSASVAVAFDQLLKERELKPGDKLLFGSAAAGFTMVIVAGEWVG